jgi:hypothetical protein
MEKLSNAGADIEQVAFGLVRQNHSQPPLPKSIARTGRLPDRACHTYSPISISGC